MRRTVAALRRAARWSWRLRHYVPLTPLGATVAALGAWLAFRYASRTTDYVLYASGLLALLVVALALVTVMLVSLGVALRLRGRRLELASELDLETGLVAATGLRLSSLRRWPLLQLRLVWEEPPEVEVTLLPRARYSEELVRPLSRGEASTLVRRFIIGDVFGFARLGLQRRSPGRLRVSPTRARVTAHVLRRFLGGDALSWPTGPAEGELSDMRRYVYGDPLRHVLWKAFARTRKLLVRTHERAITPLPSVVAYLVAGPEDEPAASAARFFVEEGLLGKDFLFSADGAVDATSDPAEALDQIIASASQRGRGAEGLERFLARVDEARRRSCVLFVPPVAGPWLERVERAASRAPKAQVVTAVDDQPLGGPESRWRRLLFVPERGPSRSLRSLGEALRRLTACGYEVHVLHRPSGELLGRTQLEALRGLDRSVATPKPRLRAARSGA
jgi:hypothetical protein